MAMTRRQEKAMYAKMNRPADSPMRPTIIGKEAQTTIDRKTENQAFLKRMESKDPEEQTYKIYPSKELLDSLKDRSGNDYAESHGLKAYRDNKGIYFATNDKKQFDSVKGRIQVTDQFAKYNIPGKVKVKGGPYNTTAGRYEPVSKGSSQIRDNKTGDIYFYDDRTKRIMVERKASKYVAMPRKNEEIPAQVIATKAYARPFAGKPKATYDSTERYWQDKAIERRFDKPKYKVTGTDRSGKRFSLKYSDEAQARGINLWRGSVYQLQPSGKYKRIKQVYN